VKIERLAIGLLTKKTFKTLIPLPTLSVHN
jgi:hypothetical protein